MYSRLSEESFSLQARFLNYWIALESLLRTGQKESLIDHIKIVVSAAHCARYVYRLLRNFIEDANRCEVNLLLPDGNISEMSSRQAINGLRHKCLFAENTLLILKPKLYWKYLELAEPNLILIKTV